MRRTFATLTTLALVASGTHAADAVYINEVLPNSPGSDTGNEYFELRGTPNMSLAGYYLLTLEGQGATKGDVNQFWNLSSFSLGANGYLFARQNYADLTPSKYTVADLNTTVVTSDGGGWQSTFEFYHGDGTQADFENGPNTVLLIKVESGNPPAYTGGQATDDLDTNNDGILDVPAGWTVVDSVGYIDGSNLTFAPASFSGPPGQPGWIVVADAGSDANEYNALWLLDPATTELNQTNTNFLVERTVGGLGWDNLNAIASLPQSGEVVTLTTDGFITAVNGSGTTRTIFPSGFTMTAGQGLAVDPITGRIWVADDVLDEVWSVDPGLIPTADIKELSFPLVDPPAPFRQMNFHDPGMAFSTNGSFLVVSDTSTAGGGGRLLIFHTEPYVAFSLSNFSITNVSHTDQGPQFQWTPAGDASFNLK